MFYNGPIGQAVVDAVNQAGGSMTLADLQGYRVRERQPLRVDMGSYELVLMPPPSSGGVCMAEALNVLHNVAADFKGGVKSLQSDDVFAPMLVYSLKHALRRPRSLARRSGLLRHPHRAANEQRVR